MDAVDAVFYEETVAPQELISAYSIFTSDSGKVVLEDLLRFCGWGAQDPTLMDEGDAKSILATQRVLWRIKAMLNATPQPEQGEDDNE